VLEPDVMARQKKEKWDAKGLRELLRIKFKQPGCYVVLEEVGNATGFSADSWIDAAVFTLWPSKGLTRAAFEIKVSRSDLIRELNQRDKNAWAREYFHEFWYLMPSDIAKPEELPAGSGWLYPRGQQLCVKVQSAHNENPKLDNEFLSALVRAVDKERQHVAGRAVAELLNESGPYQRAQAYVAAVHKFFNIHNIDSYIGADAPSAVEATILKLLTQAMDGEGTTAKLKHVLDHVSNFEAHIENLTSSFLVVGAKAMLACNEMGEFIHNSWGYPTPEDVSNYITSRADAKRDKASKLLRKVMMDELKSEKVKTEAEPGVEGEHSPEAQTSKGE